MFPTFLLIPLKGKQKLVFGILIAYIMEMKLQTDLNKTMAGLLKKLITERVCFEKMKINFMSDLIDLIFSVQVLS